VSAALAAALALLLCCGGCGGGHTHQSLAGEAITTMKEMVATLDGVKDQASARSAKPKLKSLMEKLNNINDRQSKLAAPSEQEVKSIETRYGKEMQDLQMKMAGHMMRIAFDPAIANELRDLDMQAKKG
jgi:hypothetical protein